MATHYVSGGGDALQNALLASASTSAVNQNHVFNIDDGVYSAITFGSWLSGWKNSSFVLSSLHGPEHCIIDGGTKWENDVFNSTLISAGSYCLFTDSNAQPGSFSLNCCGITFRNAYGSNGCITFQNGNKKTLSNCIVENVYLTTNGAIINATGGCNSYNISCRNINGTRYAVGILGAMHNSLIENCVSRGSTLFNQVTMNRCIVRSCSAETFMEYAANMQECLVYDISCTRFLRTMRFTNLAGNTLNINLLANHTLNNFNGNGTRIIANNIFASTTNYNFTIASNINGQVMSVFNNYAAAFTGLCCNDCVTGTNPGFVDPSEEDYHLAAGSPCISAGSWARKAYSTDLDGKYWKNPPSIGCYQYYREVGGVLPHDVDPFGKTIWRPPYTSKVEYIKVTTGSYVDTLIPFTSQTEFGGKIGFCTFGGWTYMVGTPTGSGGCHYFCNSNVCWSINGINATLESQNVLSGASMWLECRIYNGQQRAFVNGQMRNPRLDPFTTNGQTIKLGIWQGNGSSARIYGGYVKQSGTYKRNLIPVRIGNRTNGTAALYDKVSGKCLMFTSSGTTTLGPDIM